MNLQGKRAIVLGGTSGIGLATVRQLVAAGARVVAAGRSQERIAAAAAETPGAQFVSVDVLDRAALEALFVHHAGFDILVNCATGGERSMGPFLSMDLDAFRGSFRKLWGYANSIRLGVPQMAEDGAVVLVSGFPARKASVGSVSLATVGGGVEAFARAIALEIAPRRLNVVSPGIINTPMTGGTPEERSERLGRAAQRLPIPRPGTADEVAEAILFVLRNDYMTGATVDVDGGALLP